MKYIAYIHSSNFSNRLFFLHPTPTIRWQTTLQSCGRPTKQRRSRMQGTARGSMPWATETSSWSGWSWSWTVPCPWSLTFYCQDCPRQGHRVLDQYLHGHRALDQRSLQPLMHPWRTQIAQSSNAEPFNIQIKGGPQRVKSSSSCNPHFYDIYSV